MMLFKTARWRLVAWNVTVFAVLLMALGVAAYRAFSSTVYNDVDRQLEALQTRIQDKLPAFTYHAGAMFIDYPSLAQPPFRVLVADSSGLVNLNPSECLSAINPYALPPPPCPRNSLQPTSKDAIYAALSSGSDLRTVTFADSPQRVLTFVYSPGDQPLYVLQLSRDASGEVAALRTMRLLLFFGGLFGVLLAAMGSLFLANRALVPIRQAFSRQRQFTADASHELRTPLSLIRANAEMLAHHADKLPAGDCEMVEEIIRESDHLNRLVGDLLTLARADAGSLQLSIKPVDFRELVSEVHEDLHRVAESQGIQTELVLNGPTTVPGDSTRLRQLLLILLDNALKYTDPGGRVSVTLDRQNNHARLVVADTGIGIPAKDQPHIFDRFYRVDRAREHESGGTGLGLAIARWIVQAHHGSIKVDSETGKGSKFQVDLPIG